MLLASITHDRLCGRSLPGIRSLWHRVEAIKLVNERLDSPDPSVSLSDTTIYTVSRLHVLEKQYNALANNEVHTSGIHRLIVQSGGLTRLSQQHPSIEIMVYLSALVTPGMLRSAAPTLYQPDSRKTTIQEEKCILATELLAFLTDMTARGKLYSEMCTTVKDAIANTGPICKLLSHRLPVSSTLSEHAQKAMAYVNDRLRLACTLHLHCGYLLIESETGFASLVRHVEWVLSHEKLWRRSIRLMHYLLVQNETSANLAAPEMAWKVLRLAEATKLLSIPTAEKLFDALLGVLSGADGTEAIDLQSIKDELVPFMNGDDVSRDRNMLLNTFMAPAEYI